VDKKHGLEHGHSIKLQTAEGYPLLLKPPYETMASFSLYLLVDFLAYCGSPHTP
jgi:hypothetical protein